MPVSIVRSITAGTINVGGEPQAVSVDVELCLYRIHWLQALLYLGEQN